MPFEGDLSAESCQLKRKASFWNNANFRQFRAIAAELTGENDGRCCRMATFARREGRELPPN